MENTNQLETMDRTFNGKTYDEVWTDRFQFFKNFGAPNTKTFKEELKKLPMMKRMRVNANWYAFFFSFIYFFIKGMWKGALTMILLWVIIVFVGYKFPIMGTPLSFIYAMIGAFTANYTYYRKVVLGEDDFNIFKGMRM